MKPITIGGDTESAHVVRDVIKWINKTHPDMPIILQWQGSQDDLDMFMIDFYHGPLKNVTTVLNDN